MTQRGPLRLAPEVTAADLRRRGIAAREDSIADPGAFGKGAGRANGALKRANFSARSPPSLPPSPRSGRAGRVEALLLGVRAVRGERALVVKNRRSQRDISPETMGHCPWP